jgi:hypothetical protein
VVAYYRSVFSRGSRDAWQRWKDHLRFAVALVLCSAAAGFFVGPRTASVTGAVSPLVGIAVAGVLAFACELVVTPVRLARESHSHALAELIPASERYAEWAIHLDTIPNVLRAESPTDVPADEMGRRSVAWYLQHTGGSYLEGSRDHFKAAVKRGDADPSERAIVENPGTSSTVVADLFRTIAERAKLKEGDRKT